MDEQRGAEAPDGIAPADSASESSLGQLTWPRNASAQRGRADLHLAATSSEPATGQLVYALGQVAYDFPSRARRESMKQAMDEGSPEDPSSMIAHLEAHPADAAALQWILELEGIPVYFIYPAGPFAGDIFTALRTFLREQIEEGVERVSVPGTVVGAAAHRIGVDLPVIAPELRGMYSWTTEALVSSLQSADGTSEAKKPRADAKSGDVSAGVAAFLDRVYFDLRNPGIADRDRALNYAATNAFSIEHIYEEAIREEMELDTIEVEESAVGIPGLSMWDVKLAFFFPNRPTPSPRRMYRFTVSVEDVIPTTIGPVRSWSVR